LKTKKKKKEEKERKEGEDDEENDKFKRFMPLPRRSFSFLGQTRNNTLAEFLFFDGE